MRPVLRLQILIAMGGVLVACGGGIDPNAPLSTWEERGVLWVDADDLHGWMDAGHGSEVVFIDNRNAFTYDQQHIAGARLIGVDAVQRSLGSLPLNKWLIMYCT